MTNWHVSVGRIWLFMIVMGLALHAEICFQGYEVTKLKQRVDVLEQIKADMTDYGEFH